MKIRVYSPFFPYPVTEGAFRVIFDQIVSLQTLKHPVELVTWKKPISPHSRKTWAPQWPSPTCTSLLEKTQSTVWRVSQSLLSDTASPEFYYYPVSVQKDLSTLAPCDLAIYHYSFAHLWLKTPHDLPSETRRVIHFHNLESELFYIRSQNENSLFSQGSRWIHRRNERILARHELELSQMCDELWFLSPIDLETYRNRLGPHSRVSIRLVPPTYTAFLHEVRQPAPTPPPTLNASENSTVLGFVGGFDFQPNLESAQWILQKLVPELQKRKFQGRLQIMGRNAQQALASQELPEWVEILPEAYEFEKFLSDLSWMLVPHVSGSGVRIKLLDALAQRIPVLATPSAVERLHPELHTHPLIYATDDPQLWSQRIVDEPPLATRKKYQNFPFPKSMTGKEVYQFINGVLE